ncbi:hypothetical protein CDAR_393641 [Caerostris darwini]|uniref:Uncharacterized protein n=1 Tax=Caerostris darwini TaxID=1538125 RepID=A0AAV4W8B9_9ARAC|nr:hypothetical protein CDAR_393641 [Caerostris darwini]
METRSEQRSKRESGKRKSTFFRLDPAISFEELGKTGKKNPFPADDLRSSGVRQLAKRGHRPYSDLLGTVPGVPPPGWDPEAKRREYAKGGFVFVYVLEQEVAGDNCGFSERGRRRELKCIDERREKMMNGDVLADGSAAIWGRPLARDGKEPGDEVRWREERSHTCHSLTRSIGSREGVGEKLLITTECACTPLNPDFKKRGEKIRT